MEGKDFRELKSHEKIRKKKCDLQTRLQHQLPGYSQSSMRSQNRNRVYMAVRGDIIDWFLAERIGWVDSIRIQGIRVCKAINAHFS